MHPIVAAMLNALGLKGRQEGPANRARNRARRSSHEGISLTTRNNIGLADSDGRHEVWSAERDLISLATQHRPEYCCILVQDLSAWPVFNWVEVQWIRDETEAFRQLFTPSLLNDFKHNFKRHGAMEMEDFRYKWHNTLVFFTAIKTFYTQGKDALRPPGSLLRFK